MNKLKQFFFIGLAFLMPTMVFAQEIPLNQTWKYTSDLPIHEVGTDGSTNYSYAQGVGMSGKIWTNDPNTSKLVCWDETSKTSTITGTAGGAMSIDDAGNLIYSTAKYSTSCTSLKILPVGSSTPQDLTITLPTGITAATTRYFGKAIGDVTSDEGGVIFLWPQNNTKIAKITIKNGQQQSAEAIETGLTSNAASTVTPITSDLSSNETILQVARKYYKFDGTKATQLTNPTGVNNDYGAAFFVMGGKQYSVQYYGTTTGLDGFAVIDRSGSTPTIVAKHEAELTTAVTNRMNSLCVEVVNENLAYIYQYVPGGLVAQYTFGWETEDLPQKNAFAYDITVEETAVDGEDNKYIYDVSYRLSAPAESATVEVWLNGETKIKEYEGTTNASLVNGVVENLNTVSIPSEELRGGKSDNLVFKVSVVSTPVSEPTLYSKSYKFFSPYGLAINNCEDSKSFGRIFATETSTNAISKTTYMSSSANGGIGTGVYAFDPLFDPITNKDGGYGFKCGMTTSATGAKYSDVSEYILDVKRLAMSEDGRLFVGRQNPNYTGLWEINPNDLNLSGSMIFGETDKTHNIIAMSVQGSGENLKIALLENAKSGFSPTAANNKLNIYNLGGAWSWAEGAPSKAIATKVVCPQHTNICFNPDGTAVMVGQYKSGFNPSKTTPSYENYLLSSGTANWYDNSFSSWGGAMAWNVDGTLFAMAKAQKTVGVYTVDVNAEGVPTFTEKWSFNTTCGSYTTALAFDVANNLYVASNSSEVIKCWVLPNTEAVTVSAFTTSPISGVEDVLQPAVAKAYGARGEIHIQGEFNSLSVYTMSGQAVVTETCDDVIPVAKGYYIVVVDGNAQKVAVR